MRILLRLSQPLIAISILLAAGLSQAQDTTWLKGDHSRAVANAANATVNKYPDADTVVIDDTEHVRYNPDGTYEMYNDAYEKILTEKGRRERRELSFHFSTSYERVQLEKLEIIRDGQAHTINVEANAKVMVEPSQMNSNIYDPNNKILRVQVPDLQPGDLLHYQWRKQCFKPRIPDFWCGYYVLQSTSPIIRNLIVVDAPDALPLKKIAIKDRVGDTVSHVERREGGRVIHSWTAENVPMIFPEPDMPAMYTVVQRLLVSTAADWREISRWYWNLCKPRLDKTTPAMLEKVKELTAAATSPMDKIRALFRFVAADIRYMGITTEDEAPGYEPHDVCITFNNRYGVCRDKAALLASMLRLAGFEAFPVIFRNGPKMDMEVPNNYFNHAITAVRMPDGSYQLMDPTDEHTRDLLPSYQCDKSFLVASPEGEPLKTSPVEPATRNLVKVNTRCTLSPTGTLSGECVIDFEGVNDGIYRGAFMRWQPERRNDFFIGNLKRAIPGVKLKSLTILPENLADTSSPLQARLSFQAENYPLTGQDATMIPTLWIGTRFGLVNFILENTGLEKRQFPMQLHSTCGVSENFQISFEQPPKVLVIPDFKGIDNPELTWKQHLGIKDKTLSGSREFLIKTMEFSPPQYLQLKDALKLIEQAERKMPVIAAAPDEAGADAIVLKETSDFHIGIDGGVTQRLHVQKRILTYAGKKNNAELKFNYNPTWTSIKVVRAQVRTPRGEIKSFDSKELNIMDAPWAASAPRYPAAKVMVINLPGVEAGCDIEYEVEIVSKAHPFFSFTEGFRSLDPSLNKQIRLHVPEEIANNLKFQCSPDIPYNSRKESGMIIHEWNSGLQPRLRAEPSMPPPWIYTPTLFVSNGNWRKYAGELNSAFTAAAKQSPKATELALKLTREAGNEQEKLKAIVTFLSQNIRNAGPDFSFLPLSCLSNADKTLADAYGHSADRAILTHVMLQAIGFKPEFVLPCSYPDIPGVIAPLTQFPQRHIFATPLVRVRSNDGYLYLNAAGQYAPPGVCPYAGHRGLFLSNGNFDTIGIPARLETRSELNLALKIRDNGDAEMTRATTYYGGIYESFNQMYTEKTPEQRRRFLQTETAAIAESAVLDGHKISTNYPAIKEFKVNIPNFAVRDADYLYFKLPLESVRNMLPAVTDKRENPFYQPARKRFSSSCKVILPDNASNLLISPQSFSWDCPDGGGVISCNVRRENATSFNIDFTIDMNPAVISPENYREIIHISDKLSHPSTWTFLIKLKI